MHPSPQESDWSDRDWTGRHTNTQKQTGETSLLPQWYLPKPQSNPNSKPEVDKINMDKINLKHDNPQEELIQVTDLLILPPTWTKRRKQQQKRRWMLRQDSNQRKKNMNYNRRSTWASSVMRRVWNIKGTVISVKKEHFQNLNFI